MNRKINHIGWGALAGFLTPILLFVIMYFQADVKVGFYQFMVNLWESRMFGVFLKPALLLNLALFFVMMNLKYLTFCRGIILSTFIYGGLMVYLHFA